MASGISPNTAFDRTCAKSRAGVTSTLGVIIPHTLLQLFRVFGLVVVAALVSGCDSLLLWGARTNESLAVAAALAVGSNINARDEHGLTPLQWAIKEKNNEIAIQLLNKGAQIEALNNMKATPLQPCRTICLSQRNCSLVAPIFQQLL
jgi:hypothetical protein